MMTHAYQTQKSTAVANILVVLQMLPCFNLRAKTAQHPGISCLLDNTASNGVHYHMWKTRIYFPSQTCT